jgi:hypothetical protein
MLGGEAIRQGWTVPVIVPDTGTRVLVVGTGIAGHDLEVKKATHEACG